jgi:hypothetical protein
VAPFQPVLAAAAGSKPRWRKRGNDSTLRLYILAGRHLSKFNGEFDAVPIGQHVIDNGSMGPVFKTMCLAEVADSAVSRF